jgi:hypothetical protein
MLRHIERWGIWPLVLVCLSTFAITCKRGVHVTDDDEARTGKSQAAVTQLAVADDPLVRMPGTQPSDGVSLEAPGRCLNCHGNYNTQVEPGHNWKGSMMAQAARDFLFWACFTVSAQDSVWATGRPNATDICERCHFPKGWLEGRSEPTNASLMKGADYDGVHCDFCHRSYDPFYASTKAGTREGSDWTGYWDETNTSQTKSSTAADDCFTADRTEAQSSTLFNGGLFFNPADQPHVASYSEATSGQYYVSASNEKRAPFADAAARHQMAYSRFHKSRYFCSTCHDVSNPILANLDHKAAQPLDGTTLLPTEKNAAHSYFHVERTFSEFMLSAYGKPGGAAGKGPFAPAVFKTSKTGNLIAACQDCHMRDVSGAGCDKKGVPVRPGDSTEHPKSGQPLHDMTGGNIWVSWVLASATTGAANYDATNAGLLNQGPAKLTLDLTQGEGIDPKALLDGVERAKQQLKLAASIEETAYDAATGKLTFKLQNQTGHKLISGFPEGRRMFVNIKLYKGGSLLHEVNPYDTTVCTLKGLGVGDSPALAQNESHRDELVYETKPTSSLTKETKTFHFALGTGRYKDNRIPPKGFDIANAGARMSRSVVKGVITPGLFTAAEYAGGYDAVELTLATGADQVEVNLYYQVTSREYIAFLRDEINGTAGKITLPQAAYIAQSDPFFAKLKAWGDTVWQLWDHNKSVAGAAPFLMTQAKIGGTTACAAPVPSLTKATPDHGQVALTWSNVHGADASVTGYKVFYDQAGKAQLISTLGQVTTYTDTGLTNGQQYCYKVAAVTAACDSGYSSVLCATPNNQGGAQVGVGTVQAGKLETAGKGKNAVTTFVSVSTFAQGDRVVLRSYVGDASTGQPVTGASVELSLSGPASATVTSGASDASGVADATWNTQAPNKKGTGGTATGSYTATVTKVTGNGVTWDGVKTATTFTVQ